MKPKVVASMISVALFVAASACAGQAAKTDVTGKYTGQLGEADLTGTVKGPDIAFTFNVDAQGTPLTFNYKGTVESKDAMKGKVELVGLGDGTFTAKRQ